MTDHRITCPPVFAFADRRLQRIEGGLVDDPDDPGGITNRGISLRFARTLPHRVRQWVTNGEDRPPTPDDIRNLSEASATAVYFLAFWEPMRMESLPPMVAIQLLDFAANLGEGQSVKELQRATRWHGQRLDDDGKIGPLTIAAVRRIGDPLAFTFKAQVAGFYRELIARDPWRAKYRNGWNRRVAEPLNWPTLSETE